MTRDFLHAFRSLRAAPVYTLVAVTTLALGIGANSAMFSVVYAAMFRPLPYHESDRLMEVSLTIQRPGEPMDNSMVWSYPKFQTMREMQQSFAGLSAYASMDVSLTGTDNPEQLDAEMISENYFSVLGLPMLHGRGFPVDSEITAGTLSLVILGHELWQRRYGGDAAIVGRTIEIGKRRLTVAGVAPRGFAGLSGSADLWLPMSMAPVMIYPQALEERWSHWLDVVGRLREGVTAQAAATELRSLGPRIQAAHLPPGDPDPDTWGAAARTLRDARNDPALRRSILVLLGGVGLVLLIACANVANLALARAASRQRDVAVRLAIGATRRDVLRGLLVESVLLSTIGGIVGLVVATWGVDAVRVLAPASLVTESTQAAQFLNLGAVSVDAIVLLFTFVLSILTGVGFGIWPALRATRTDLQLALKDGAPGAVISLGSWRRPGARMLLVAGDVALSLMLLIGAGLLLRSFVGLRGIDAGFDPTGLITFQIEPPPDSVYSPRTAPARKAALLERLNAIPGVRSASTNMCAPLTARCNASVVMEIAGSAPFAPGTMPEIGVHSVDTAYFRTLGIPLLRGRGFTSADRAGSSKVVIINASAARKLFGDRDAIGQRIRIGIGYISEGQTAEVVGVVGDVQYRSPGTPAAPDAYVPMLAYSSARGMYLVRTDSDPSTIIPAIRNAVRQYDPDLPIFDVRTMEQRAGYALSAARFGAVLLSAFAALALVLAAVGVYGVVAYSVAQRTREIGIRMALGAAERTVVSQVLKQGLGLALAGVVLGIVGAMALTRVLGALLYDVSPTDPAIFTSLSLGLVAVTLVASLIPALRAARVDPMRALRVE